MVKDLNDNAGCNRDGQQRDSYIFFLETLDQIDGSLRKAEDLDQMMADVLDTILSIFHSDRAWLLYPCDPGASACSVPMERTMDGYPGISSVGMEIPIRSEEIAAFQAVLESDKPVAYDRNSKRRIPTQTGQQFNIRSQIMVAVYPKIGSPWLLGMHQCSCDRIWTEHEKQLFHEIGRRIADALNTLLLLQDLRTSEEKYRAVVNNSPDLIYRTDMNGVITFVSKSVRTLSGRTAEEIIGMRMAEEIYVVPEERILFLTEVLKNGFIENFEAQFKHKNGSTWWGSANAHVLKDLHGNIQGIEGIIRNITERKQIEAERQKLEEQLRQSHKMEAIGTLSGGIAHDFNNILGIILGNAELAVNIIEEGHPAQLNLEEINKAGRRASDVVKQLLNFSRKTQQKKKIIDIDSIINEAITLLRSSIPASIEIQPDIPSGLRRIKADPTQIHQILINLCANAAHAMEKDGGVLKIDLSEIELDNPSVSQFQEIGAGRYLQLTISDTGHGIDPTTKANIFDPYFTTKAVGKGTGMGLAIVLGIVKNHNGAISVYSEPGRGSTFKVLFPVAEGDAVNGEEISQDLPRGNETILLIDDEAALVKIGKDILGGLGYKVEARTDPAEAFDLFRSDPSRFDLIVTDMTMPHMTGEQLIKAVLKINPKLPVILCTGFSNQMNGEKAIMIGAHSYIEKPFNKMLLADKVRKALDDC